MKTKDFGFFQQHAEKLALGLGAVVILGVGATQFLMGEPNAVEINNQPVSPGEIKETVIKDFQRLDRNLKGDSYVELIEIPKYADSFRRLYERPVASDTTLGPFDVGGLAANWLRIKTPDYPRKFLPAPPVPTEILAKAGNGVLANNGSQFFPEIRSIIGDQEPADFPYVSVSASFSFEDWSKRLEAQNVPEVERIDPGLWQPRLLITSVRLLREEQDPITGQWTGLTTIDPMPGQFAILPDDTRPRELEDAQAMEKWLLDNQPDFRRPVFPEIVNGPWTPPDQSNRVFTPEELARQRELEREIATLKRTLDRLTGNDQRGNDGRRDRRQVRPRQQPGGFDEFDGGGGGDRRPRGNRNDDRENDRAAQAREREQQRIRDTEDKLFEAETELNELLGIDEEVPVRGQRGGPGAYGNYGGEFDRSAGIAPGRATAPSGYGGPEAYGNPSRTGAGQVPDRVKVWAHDLTAKAGKTYRYKVLISVMNPLYRFPRLNEAQRGDNFDRVAITHDPTELEAASWSAPLELDPKYQFFVLSGSKDQKRANFEVWTVFDGKLRKNEFTEYPGNEIGGLSEAEDTGREFTMNVGSIMLDVDSVPAPNGRGSVVRVLFLNPETGRIDYRLINEDKNSNIRQRLENQQQREIESDNIRVGDAARS